jgi:hypothetical protein
MKKWSNFRMNKRILERMRQLASCALNEPKRRHLDKEVVGLPLTIRPQRPACRRPSLFRDSGRGDKPEHQGLPLPSDSFRAFQQSLIACRAPPCGSP